MALRLPSEIPGESGGPSGELFRLECGYGFDGQVAGRCLGRTDSVDSASLPSLVGNPTVAKAANANGDSSRLGTRGDCMRYRRCWFDFSSTSIVDFRLRFAALGSLTHQDPLMAHFRADSRGIPA